MTERMRCPFAEASHSARERCSLRTMPDAFYYVTPVCCVVSSIREPQPY
jgi:hypothetical protein